MHKGLKIAAAVLALVLLGCSAAFSAMAMLSVRAVAQEISREEQQGTAENDVHIAGQYVIRATTQISDAYLSGDSSQLNDRDKETLAMASAVLDQIITADMSPFEKETAVYDWMVSNLAFDQGALVVIPTTGADSDSPYGVLKYHNAVCVGYATTFRLFMQMLDIPCMVVHNTELYHSWDLVQLDDHWYHVDIYSDVGQGGYAHFNVPDSVRLQQQNWDTDFFPAADSLAYNIGWQNRQTVDSVYDVPAGRRRAVDDRLGACAVAFSCDITGADSQVVDSMVNALDSALCQGYYPDLSTGIWDRCWVQDTDGTYGLLLSFHYDTEEEPDPTIDDTVDWDQADQALRDAFSDLFDLSLYGDYYNDPWA